MRRGIRIALAGVTLALGTAAGGWWWWHRPSPSSACQAKEPLPDPREYKYLDLEKVIVMLHRAAEDSTPHYLAMDLVIKAPAENELAAREQLPLLRSVVVKDLSSASLDDINHLSVEELTQRLNKALVRAYAVERTRQPFANAMIGKLVVE